MARTVTLTTPENVRIEYELGGIASRALATLLDLFFQGLLILAGFLVLLALNVQWVWAGTSWATAVMIVALFLILWGYYVLFETIWNGQTPGKRLFRLRVIKEPGMPVDVASAAIRNLVRIIDFLPSFYVVGGIAVFATGDCKRLGDLAAGTLVVKERSEALGPAIARPAGPPEPRTGPAFIHNIELISAEEFDALKQFSLRRAELMPSKREELAARIARPIMRRLGIEDAPDVVYSNLLIELYRRCCEERGMR